jgi:SNF2 family DNA or RNA helicase
MQVQVSAKHKMLAVPFAESLNNLFPAARQIQFAGGPHLLLPHRPTETFLLRRMGYDVPAPILTHYDWCGGKPFNSQKSTAALLTLEQRAYVLNGMGTGKTKSALWAFDYLRSNNVCGKMLVSAPLSTLTFTWAREVFNTLPHRKCAVLHGSKKKRLERLADPSVDIFIINHDGHMVILDELMARPDINVICIDELAVFRNGGSNRTKGMFKLTSRNDVWVWGMTGSPIPTSPTDAWAQARLVTPTRVPKYFDRYRDELMTKAAAFKYAPKPDAVERAYDTLQPAVRFTLDDVTELPECIERTVDVEMGAKQQRIYQALVAQCYAAVKTDEITAANAGAVMMKLLQVSTGWVYSKAKNVVALDNNKRIEALIDAIYATDRKVLVFVPFKHAVAGISDALHGPDRTKPPLIEHACVDGDTPAGDRAQIFNLFQNTSKYRVLVAHPQCLAHGITLTAADTVIWFAPVTSLEIYDQANHRIRRVGQKHKQLVLHLQSTPVERKIYRMLQSKQQVQNRLLKLFEENTEITAEAA